MLPKIPTINFVIKHQSKPFNEEFESFNDLLDFVIFDLPEVGDSMALEWFNSELSKNFKNDRQMLRDFAGDHLEDFLGENGYTLSRIVKG